MKNNLITIFTLLALCSTPMLAEETPEQLVVKARANVLACALEMLSMDGGQKYPELLANGIRMQVRQMKHVEDMLDDLDEDKVMEAENHLVCSANFSKLSTDFRRAMSSLATRAYYGSEELQDAMEDLEDEIDEME